MMARCPHCGAPLAAEDRGDLDAERHAILIAGRPRHLPGHLWQAFAFLYRQRGHVVSAERLASAIWPASLPAAPNALREVVRELRRELAGSRWRIATYRLLGYELIEAPAAAAPPPLPGRIANLEAALKGCRR